MSPAISANEAHYAQSAAEAGRKALPRLTSLRGLAALVVFWFHAFGELLSTNETFNNTLVNAFAGPGEASVACFFMLSGFVLVWVARPGDTAKSFYRRRIAKVYPNHAVTWLIGLVVIIALGHAYNILALLPSLALVQVWLPKESVIEGTNGPAWTLACEMFFYALFPWLAVKVARVAPERRWTWIYRLIGASVAFTIFVAFAVPTEPRTEVGPAVPVAQFYTLFFLPPVRLLEFVAGMVLAHIVLNGQWPKTTGRQVVGAFAAAYALSLIIPAPLGYLAPFLPGVVLLIGNAATNDLEGRPSWLTSRPLMWMGETSFGFYLIHWIVLHHLRIPLGDGPWGYPATIGYWLLCFAISLIVGRALYRYVELPGVRRWSKSRAEKEASAARRAAAAAAAEVAVNGTPAPAPVGVGAVVPPPVNPTYAEHARAAGLEWPPQRRSQAEVADDATQDTTPA